MPEAGMEKAAERGNPSFVWRAGQERRYAMIRDAAGERIHGRVFEDGCGVGQYLHHLAQEAALAVGLDVELDRVREANAGLGSALLGVGEALPLPGNTFDLVLSHEVLEHVDDDRMAAQEIVRVLKPGGRLVLFVPNRGYPFETHGIYRNGVYHFGNKLFINYLPRRWRDQLAPHVRVYSRRDLAHLFSGLPVRVVRQTVIFGAYDNIIGRFGGLGKALRGILQALERTPLRVLGLSHFWVVEKI
ncbi:MAG: methyltransferase domain-containing protein [Anaerolineae bacterium]|nr:methyltransferase domain-containing protein [Anaerolineae bacterium]